MLREIAYVRNIVTDQPIKCFRKRKPYTIPSPWQSIILKWEKPADDEQLLTSAIFVNVSNTARKPTKGAEGGWIEHLIIRRHYNGGHSAITENTRFVP